jgi:hypothetical protein
MQNLISVIKKCQWNNFRYFLVHQALIAFLLIFFYWKSVYHCSFFCTDIIQVQQFRVNLTNAVEGNQIFKSN